MELGALVCTARAPRCPECPLSASCAWRLAGQPPPDGPSRRPQRYAGTDRQVRGLLLAVLRDATEPVPAAPPDPPWPGAAPRRPAPSRPGQGRPGCAPAGAPGPPPAREPGAGGGPPG